MNGCARNKQPVNRPQNSNAGGTTEQPGPLHLHTQIQYCRLSCSYKVTQSIVQFISHKMQQIEDSYMKTVVSKILRTHKTGKLD